MLLWDLWYNFNVIFKKSVIKNVYAVTVAIILHSLLYTFVIEENTEFVLKVSRNNDLIFPIQIHICFVKHPCYRV